MTSLASQLASIKKMYRQLPYIAFQHYKRYYLLPQRPLKPKPKHMQVIHETNYQTKKFYDGNSISKFKGDFKQILLNEDKISWVQQQHSKNFSQYHQKLKVYNQLYIKPLKIKGVTAIKIFRKEAREKELKRLGITNQNQRHILSQFKTAKILKVWHNLSQQQKEIYKEKQRVFRLANVQILTNFIQKHEIPFVNKCPPISIYGARYMSDYFIQSGQTKITAQFLLKFKKLPKQQIQSIKKQASHIYQQRKLKYQNFLQRWNLKDQQLKRIVEVSDRYKQLANQSRSLIFSLKRQDQSEDQQLGKLEAE